jgi:hypothetical protein
MRIAVPVGKSAGVALAEVFATGDGAGCFSSSYTGPFVEATGAAESGFVGAAVELWVELLRTAALGLCFLVV